MGGSICLLDLDTMEFVSVTSNAENSATDSKHANTRIHAGPVTCVASSSGGLVLCGSMDGDTTLWEIERPPRLKLVKR